MARRAFDQRVLQLRTERDGLAFRQCPRRGGPDRDGDNCVTRVHTKAGGEDLRVDGIVSDIHRRRGLVGVLNLGLGQRRGAIEAPVHGLGAAQHMAVGDDLGQRAQHVCLVLEIHRAVRMLPVAKHPEALEIGALGVDLLRGVFAAFLPKRNGVELVARLAEFLLHGNFNRQAVAIPARHIRRAIAGQQLGLDRDVLENLVHRMADVNRAIRIRRAIVQHKHLVARGGAFLDLAVKILALPLRQPQWLAPWQIGAHRERGLRQVDRAFVIVGHCLGAIAVCCFATRANE